MTVWFYTEIVKVFRPTLTYLGDVVRNTAPDKELDMKYKSKRRDLELTNKENTEDGKSVSE